MEETLRMASIASIVFRSASKKVEYKGIFAYIYGEKYNGFVVSN